MPWLASVGGVVIVLVVLRDVFHTLLHPAGHGELSRAVMRTAWYIARRSGAGGMRLAGPLSVLAVIATWVALTVLGWALLYLPHVPDAFSYAPGLDPARRSDVGDALYVSLVVGATLGFGDLPTRCPPAPCRHPSCTPWPPRLRQCASICSSTPRPTTSTTLQRRRQGQGLRQEDARVAG